MSAKIETTTTSSRFNLNLLLSRIRGISLLNAEEVITLKQEQHATPQAVGVLVISALAYGLGYTLLGEIQSNTLSIYGIIVGGLATMIISCFSAIVWSIAVFFVGTKLFKGTTTFWELARPMFFSTAPGILFLLIAIPYRPIIIAITVIAVVWLVVSQTFVVKHVMGFGLQRTVLTLMVGFLILAFVGLTFQH
jgi:hypothetical protein